MITKDTENKMKGAIEHYREELKKIRTGHANPGMVENIQVEVYGTFMRLKEMASITSPESRQLMILPYDKKNSESIGKAIQKANLGFMPIVDGNGVRINIPPMDENLRKEMVKLCHKELENAKISIRTVRRDANETVKKQKTAGDLSEDIQKKLEKEIQELTDKYCKLAETVCEQKEKEVASI